MRSFLKKTTIYSLVICLLLIFINSMVDPAKLLKSKYEKNILSILKKGNNVTNVSNYDDRKFQKLLISSLEIEPELSIMGSSRTMIVGKEYLPDMNLINNSVTRANINDLTALFQVYLDHDILPETFVFGLDPSAFSEIDFYKRWYSISDEYFKFHDKSSTPLFFKIKKYSVKFRQLISISYFQESFKMISDLMKGSIDPIATNEKYNRTNTILTDGSIRHNPARYQLGTEEISEKANMGINSFEFGLYESFTISREKINDFKRLLSSIQKNDREVILYLPPFNPVIYNDLVNKYPSIIELEEQIRNIANERNIEIFGSYNPSRMNLNIVDFYDGWHLKEIPVNNIFKEQLNKN